MPVAEIINRILETRDVHTLTGGATDEELSACENEIGLPIPPEYKQFLAFSNGAVLYETEELLGSRRLWELAETIAEVADRLRSSARPLPATLLPFYGGGNGRYLCFDLGQLSPEGATVIVEWLEDQGSGAMSYPSFTAWFQEELIGPYHSRYSP